MAKKELTLKDRLSRLTFAQACKLLGPEGNRLIMRGGKFEISSSSLKKLILNFNLPGSNKVLADIAVS